MSAETDQAAAADALLHEELGKGLELLIWSAPRYDLQARTFFEHADVLDEISVLFAHIISYVVRIQCHFAQNPVLRAAKSLSSTPLKLDDLYKEIAFREQHLDWHLSAIAHQRKI
jgi:hypothetical protein